MQFPQLAESIKRWESRISFEFIEPRSAEIIGDLESDLEVALPESYKRFLQLTSEMRTRDWTVRIGYFHFYHDSGPGKGMLCFGDFFMLADGDQVLFDTTRDPTDGEYAVMYYAHEASPPRITKLADSFPQFLGEFMDYEDWGEYEEDEEFEPGFQIPSWISRVSAGFASLVCLILLVTCLIALIRGFTWNVKMVYTIIIMPTFLAWMGFYFGVFALTGIDPHQLYERWKYRSGS